MSDLNVVLVDMGGPEPPALHHLAGTGRCHVRRLSASQLSIDSQLLSGVDAVLIACANGQTRWTYQHYKLIEHLHSRRIGTLIIQGPDGCLDQNEPSLASQAGLDIPADELWGRLSTMAGYRPLLQRIERELDSMERLGKRLNQHFVEMDQELRLASRLQQDFLPRQLLRLGDLKFAALYRPAGFVSGDIYDVTRVDEDHVAFYVADAVGHGVAAGLLTMFIKQAIRSKRIRAEDYELLSPAETIGELNEVLAAQDLSNSQFVSACYCLLNVKTHVLRFARAGHPYPIRISADGCLTELKSEGGLLGLFPGEEFANRSVQLTPGDRVVLLTDGLEDAFPESRGVGLAACGSQQFANLVRQPAEQAVAGLADLLDGQQGSLEPQDDVTLVVLEVGQGAVETASTQPSF